MICNHCGKEGVHVCISAGFSALVLADQLGETAMSPYATSELRRLHAKSEADKVLLRQALDTLAYWLEHGETPGSHDMIQRTHDALQELLGETK